MKLKSEKWELIFNWLRKNNETVATMESCTGGYLANMITNYPGSSDIFSLGIVSYSNQVKIDCGVPKEVINKYTVYSKQTAQAMAQTVAAKVDATYGIGITGELSNPNGITYICIYDAKTKQSYYRTISLNLEHRYDEKTAVVNLVIDLMLEICGLA